MSSASFRVLLIAAKTAGDHDCVFALCSLSHETRRLFEMGDFIDFFSASTPRAREALPAPLEPT